MPDIHVGELILKYLRDNDISQGFLAKKINMPTSNLSRLLKKKSISTKYLSKISFELDHNFYEAFMRPEDKYENDDRPMGAPIIGDIIDIRLKELGMSQAEFAVKLNTTPSDVSRILKRQDLDTDKLTKISCILKYNFFRDFYKDNSIVDYVTGAPIDFLKRYEELVIENEHLRGKLMDAEAEIERMKKLLDEANIPI